MLNIDNYSILINDDEASLLLDLLNSVELDNYISTLNAEQQNLLYAIHKVLEEN